MYNSIFKLPETKNLTPNTFFSINDILRIAHKAGCEIMKIYNQDFDIEYKDDKSPLTEADKKSHEIIESGLKSLSLNIGNEITEDKQEDEFHNNFKDNTLSLKSYTKNPFPLLSEEGKNIQYKERKKWELFWMIDPLDGTKEFIKKNGEFTVNIALIYQNEPIFGVVYAPAIEQIYFTDNSNSYKANLSIDKFELKNINKLPIKNFLLYTDDLMLKTLTIVASKSHLNEETKTFINNLAKHLKPKTLNFISKGSSLKLCMVAEGRADIYPRLAPTMEWDTAAADAIVRKSGKLVYKYEEDNRFWVSDLRPIISDTKESLNAIRENKQSTILDYFSENLPSKPLLYNKENLLNPWFLVM